ncbi:MULTISPECIES: FAD-dependent oxidoreductase [unclassified Streptomyces]|uniref:NAD(P)/FAD-dependent oxidoreductase n=1 Tax=unclassified Streptomyces TaxID=2593676 RepID=UPI00081D6668|nr:MULTISPECIES: FAD-dependent oxidoreductase [unclassified Streptomyces]MYR26586.1 FAD-dependent oxidoreductase [Streptomyces sp. SID4945]SCF06793.1 3-phenylpropionate/trans-cinnamate dioxygenase ferredoxin reductase subunit [Streptomyces sp. LcepLS]
MSTAGDTGRSVVVVGASAAGLAVAEGLRAAGFAGRVALIGAEGHLPYDRPPLSKQLLSGAWSPARLALRQSAEVDALGLDLRLGVAATGVDVAGRRVALADGSSYAYDDLVVATGTRARRLPGTEGLANVHVLRTLEDALALRETVAARRSLVVVGGGFVGAEAAAVARTAGCEVTLVTDTPQPMSDALGEELGAMLRAVHEEHGVRIETGVLVDRVLAAEGRASGVVLADGRRIGADAVLVGIGAIPRTEWLADSGLPLGDGVVCDPCLRAAPGVWAAGDIAAWPDPVTGVLHRVEHRTNAGEQGLAVARNILAGPGNARPFTSVPYVWSDQYELKIQIYGSTRGADDITVVEGDTASRRLVAVYGREGRLRAAVGVNMIRALRGYRPRVADGGPLERSAA